MAQHNDLGAWGEQIAAEYLKSKGWIVRHRDWSYKHKDLDIVCIDIDCTTLVFVEVKTRSTDTWGRPEEAIDLEKSHNLIIAGAAYMRTYKMNNLQIRYDSISIVGTPDTEYEITHRENIIDPTLSYQYYERKRKQSYYLKTPKKGRW